MRKPYDLAPDDRADASVRKILRQLFVALLSNVDGVVEDADIEFLHDLRVANRRTRTVLSQIRGVLPSPVMESVSPEFKWLGSVTGPCRDLDVFLLAVDSRQQQLEIDGDVLGPLGNFLREKRHSEHLLVSTALQSERFRRLIEFWDRFLETRIQGESRSPLASTPIIELAGPRILKAYRKTRRRGKGIDVDASADLLHRLRIDAKKLRYLLEFFSALYPLATVRRLIGELKQLQDILGDFSDTEVQLALITELTQSGAASAEILTDTRSLTNSIEERQRQLRVEFAERFAEFASDDSRKSYKGTFKAR